MVLQEHVKRSLTDTFQAVYASEAFANNAKGSPSNGRAARDLEFSDDVAGVLYSQLMTLFNTEVYGGTETVSNLTLCGGYNFSMISTGTPLPMAFFGCLFAPLALVWVASMQHCFLGQISIEPPAHSVMAHCRGRWRLGNCLVARSLVCRAGLLHSAQVLAEKLYDGSARIRRGV